MKKIVFILISTLVCLSLRITFGQNTFPETYNLKWESQSENSSGSMPCGGGDIGLNVWVEKGELFFYISRSGTFDENNAFLKLGRIRVKLSPNPFDSGKFSQELVLDKGYVRITGGQNEMQTEIRLWTDVYLPVIHLEIQSKKPLIAEASYENWRFMDLNLRGSESFATSLKWSPFENLKTLKDSIRFEGDAVLFYHRNTEETVFDFTVHQQGMDSVKAQMFDPLKNLTFGGIMFGKNMKQSGIKTGKYLDTDFKAWVISSKSASTKQELSVILHTSQTEIFGSWKSELDKTLEQSNAVKKTAFERTTAWWKQYWEKSYIITEPDGKDLSPEKWQAGRNYQLFRYMLGCNAFGSYPTKFNGGLFTFDPRFTDSARCYTPDYRNWGGGTFTAQNQRLVYFPMLKNGDFELMKPQFDFYLRILKNAELRSKIYWNHPGACFTEQMENFGLPNCAEYGWERPDFFDKGLEYNAWLEYLWDTSLEFCLMMLETYFYQGEDISEYIPLIKSCLVFFDDHYQYLARLRGRKALDANGHLILYPGSGCETYKMAYNSTSTIAALKTVLNKLLLLPAFYLSTEEREKYTEMLERIPPIEFREINGYVTISPAKHWERINNTETPQLYPVFPWGIYGVGKPGLDTAVNTYKYDTDALKFRSHTGWKQDNIFAARLGLTEEAAKLTILKLKDSGRRFPAFWGPGFDWVPDHNWGGSGMIGLQEMLLQTADNKIYLFPAWPKDWNVHFKLHAPGNTIVEAELKQGSAKVISVVPEERRKDIILVPFQQE